LATGKLTTVRKVKLATGRIHCRLPWKQASSTPQWQDQAYGSKAKANAWQCQG